jgi:hypothetical protein
MQMNDVTNPFNGEGDEWFRKILGRICVVMPKTGRKLRARLIGIVDDGFLFESKNGNQWFMRRDHIDELTAIGAGMDDS